MAVCVAPTDQRNHRDDTLRTLRQLASCEIGRDNVQFCFDVPLRQYSASIPTVDGIHMTGDLSLAIYNDLKLSEYILEDDNSTTREKRYFSLTKRGREVAASVPD